MYRILQHSSTDPDWELKVQEEAGRQIQRFQSWVEETDTDPAQMEYHDLYRQLFELAGGYQGEPPGITDPLVRCGLNSAVNAIEKNQFTLSNNNKMTNFRKAEEPMLPVGHLASKKAEQKAAEQKELDTYLSNGEPILLPNLLTPTGKTNTKAKNPQAQSNYSNGSEPPFIPINPLKPAGTPKN